MTEKLPNPNVNLTQTAAWWTLVDEDAENAATRVILHNQRQLARAMQTIGKQNEHIIAQLAIITKQKRTGQSTEGSVLEEEDTSDGKLAAKELRTKWFDTIFDHYRSFITSKGKRSYLTVTKNTTKDAGEFWEQEKRFFAELDANHPIPGLIAELNDDLKANVYVFMGKKAKEDEAKLAKDGKKTGLNKSKPRSNKRKRTPVIDVSSESDIPQHRRRQRANSELSGSSFQSDNDVDK